MPFLPYNPPLLRLLKTPEAEAMFLQRGEEIPNKPPKGELKMFWSGGRNPPPIITANHCIETHAQSFGITKSGKTTTITTMGEQLIPLGLKQVFFDSHKQDFISLPDMFPQVRVCKMDVDPVETATKFYTEPHTSIVFDRLGVPQSEYVPFALNFTKTIWTLSLDEKQAVDKSKASDGTQEKFITPIKLYMPEAQNFLPNAEILTRSVADTELKAAIRELMGLTEEICRQGISFGKSWCFDCQRPTDMITSIRAQVEMYFLHRQTSYNEIEHYVDILPAGSYKKKNEIKEKTRELKKGDCFFLLYGKSQQVHVMNRKTRHGSDPVGLRDVQKFNPM